MITAMTTIFVLLVLTVVLFLIALGLAREINGDGYGHRPPPRSHADDDASARPLASAR